MRPAHEAIFTVGMYFRKNEFYFETCVNKKVFIYGFLLEFVNLKEITKIFLKPFIFDECLDFLTIFISYVYQNDSLI